ncbi:uncharacterized protein FIBRA_02716 [Fibroporia radiculosa]|uniref:Uncharacterized protein n=1 Tax=Fibroporia radiculosa TaxID=599839 RepID=J4HVD4_9APHY|nr:uncharacterized protein FIBRA_02716 [Fibroporia radiculosa]CCM00677.1 predicted protein [Fibroporia radiculosa]
MADLIPQVCTATGTLFILYQLYCLLDFVWFYFIRRSSIRRFIHRDGPSPYALITGAPEGIGKAVASELYDTGFNLILHGRNEDEVRTLMEELRARPGTRRDVRYFVADASKPGHNFAQLVEPFKELNITIVIHNVDGNHFTLERMDKTDEMTLTGVAYLNAFFPLCLTRVLLPQLRASSARGLVEVQFVGSNASFICPPGIPVYASSKAFIWALAHALDADERLWGPPSNLHFSSLIVGEVQTNSQHSEPSFTSPSAERFAKDLVAKIGCGRIGYAPWIAHGIMKWVSGFWMSGIQKMAAPAIKKAAEMQNSKA